MKQAFTFLWIILAATALRAQMVPGALPVKSQIGEQSRRANEISRVSRLIAQGKCTISGRVVAENGLPMNDVVVTLMHKDSASSAEAKAVVMFSMREEAVTDAKGFFSLTVPRGKDYGLSFTCVGYHAGKLDCRLFDALSDAFDFGTVTMAVKTVEIGQVVVTAVNNRRFSDMMTYTHYITADPARATSNMSQMAAKLPFVTVDPAGNIKVAGKETYIVLRNGRPDPLFKKTDTPLKEVMERLPAMGFTRITIMLDPPAEYRDYDYVINIESDRSNRLLGVVGATSADYDMQSGRLDLKQGVTGSADKLRFAGSVAYNRFRTPDIESGSTRRSFADNTTTDAANTSRSSGQGWKGNIEASYDLRETRVLVASFDIGRQNNESAQQSRLTTTAAGLQTAVRDDSYRKVNTSEPVTGVLGYLWNSKDMKRRLTTNYLFSTLSTEQDETLLSDDQGPATGHGTRTLGSVDDLTHQLTGYYAAPLLKKVTFSAKANYLYKTYRSIGEGFGTDGRVQTPDPSRERDMRTEVSRLDGNLDFTWRANKNLDLSAGTNARYYTPFSKTFAVYGQHTETIAQEGLQTAYGGSIRYMLPARPKKPGAAPTGRPAPGGVSRTPSRKYVQLSYNMLSLRPASSQLSNYVDERRSDFIITGNPSLKDEDYHQFFLMYSNMGRHILRLQYRHSDNRITTYWFENQAGQTVQTYINGGKYRFLSFEPDFFIPMAGSMLIVMSRLNYTSDEKAGQTSESLGAFASASYSRSLVGALSFSAGVNFAQNWSEGYSGYRSGIPLAVSAGLTYRAKFTEGSSLELNARVDNVLAWRNDSESFVHSPQFDMEQYSRNRITPVSFGASLSFGRFKVKPLHGAGPGAGRVEGFSTGGAN